MTNQTLLESVEGLKNKTISGILRMTEQVGLGIFPSKVHRHFPIQKNQRSRKDLLFLHRR